MFCFIETGSFGLPKASVFLLKVIFVMDLHPINVGDEPTAVAGLEHICSSTLNG
jgi:hypothetical protein